MNRATRHALAAAVFVSLFIYGCFTSSGWLDVGAQYQDSTDEVMLEDWDYTFEARKAYCNSKGKMAWLLKSFALHTPLPSWEDGVHDDRTHVSEDFYTPLHMRVVAGPNMTRSMSYVNTSITRSRALISEAERYIKQSNEMVNGVISPAHQEQSLDTDSVARVLPLPATIQRTVPGGTTTVDPVHVCKMFDCENVTQLHQRDVHLYNFPRVRATVKPSHGWRKFFISFNLYKNERLIPFMTQALIAFLEDEIAPFYDIATSVVVSIYANTSPDLTSPLIRSLLIPYLQKAGVEVIYATVMGVCQGYLERDPRVHGRIEWMACVRNKVLEPYYELGNKVFSSKGGADATAVDDERSTVVLFLNDIFFRPKDLTALLESVAEPEMEARIQPDGVVHTSAEQPKVERLVEEAPVPGTTFDFACGMDFYISLYDTWVTRDRFGEPFSPLMPYTVEPETQAALRRIFQGGGASRRFAVPVKSCWNGVAAIRGSFFLAPTPTHRHYVSASVGEGRDTDPTWGSRRTPNSNATPDQIVTPSGMIYDRVSTQAARAVLDTYYMKIVADRLQNERQRWHQGQSLHADIGERPSLPPYDEVDPAYATVSLIHEARRIYNATPALQRDVVVVSGEARGAPYAPLVGLWRPFRMSKATHYEGSDGTYYRARYAAVRFRTPFAPSYGATVRHSSHLHRLSVRDDVCHSSECLLICQDIIHAALLQDGRTAVILMNPNVRVAYEFNDFKRVTSSRLYQSPTFFVFMSVLTDCVHWVWWTFQTLRRPLAAVQRWTTTFVTSPGDSDQHPDKGNDHFRLADVVVKGRMTSAADDWLGAERPEDSMMWVRVTGAPPHDVYLNITQYTSMGCFSPLRDPSRDLFGLLLWSGRMVSITALLVWLYRDALWRTRRKWSLAMQRGGAKATTEGILPGVWRIPHTAILAPEEWALLSIHGTLTTVIRRRTMDRTAMRSTVKWWRRLMNHKECIAPSARSSPRIL